MYTSLTLYLFINIYFLCVATFKCYDVDKNCWCSSFYDAHNWVRCSESFEINVYEKFPSSVDIFCNYAHTEWSNDFQNLNLEIGRTARLWINFCKAPSSLQASNHSGANAAKIFQSILGVTKVIEMKLTTLRSQLSNKELEPYPNLEKVFISQSDLRNLNREFFSCKLTYLKTICLHLMTQIYLFFQDSPLIKNMTLLENEFDFSDDFPRTNLFDSLENLEALIFVENIVSSLQSGMFQRLTRLEELDLSANSFRSLPKNLFKGLGSLRTVFLKNNNISFLRNDLFRHTPNLEIIEISNNEHNNMSLPSKLFYNLKHLRVVSFLNSNLATLPEKIFYNCKNLLRLNLRSTNLGELPLSMFEDFPNLNLLNLSKNNLTQIPDGLFKNLRSLESLDLSDNNLSIIGL